MKNVLLIAGLGERYYYDAFVAPCIEEGLTLYVFDPSRIPNQAAINMTLDRSGSVLGFVDVLEHVGENLVGRRLQIRNIDVAWYLRENSDDSEEDAESLEIRFAKCAHGHVGHDRGKQLRLLGDVPQHQRGRIDRDFQSIRSRHSSSPLTKKDEGPLIHKKCYP